MAQVIKLQEGGPTPLLFKDGEREIRADFLKSNADNNLQSYLLMKGWNKRKQEAFLEAYNTMSNEIASGDIAERNMTKSYIDKSGKVTNSSKRGFDPYGEVANYLNTIVDAMDAYQDPSKNLEKYDNDAILTQFRNDEFGGNDPDLQIWLDKDQVDSTTNKRDTTNRVKAFSQILSNYYNNIKDKNYDFTGTPYKDKTDLLSRIQNAINQLNDGSFDNNDYEALSRIGIKGDDARALFSTGSLDDGGESSNSEASTSSTPADWPSKFQGVTQGLIDEMKKKLTEEYINKADSIKAQTINLPKSTLSNEGAAWMSKNTDMKKYLENLGWLMRTYDPITHQDMDVYNGIVDKKGNKLKVKYLQHIANNLAYLKDAVGVKLNDGWYYLPYTASSERGTGLLYNPTTNQLKEESIMRIPGAFVMLLQQYIKNITKDLPQWIDEMSPDLDTEQSSQDDEQNGGLVQSLKKGGVIKFQSGGYFDNIDFGKLNDYYQQAAAQDLAVALKKKEKEKEDLENKLNQELQEAASKGMTVELYRESLRKPSETEWTGADIADLTSAGLDVASLIAAFVPGYGTITSAVTGAGSSLTLFGADWARDGLDWGDVGNLGINLVLDTVGVLPGSNMVAKGGKIAKTLFKFIPKIINIVKWAGVVQGLSNSGEIIKSFNLLTSNPSKMTVQDWKNIGEGIKLATAGTRAGVLKYKEGKFKAETATDNFNLKLNDGRQVTLKPDLIDLLKSAQNTKEANTLLLKFTGDKTAQVLSTWLTKLASKIPFVGKHIDLTPKIKTRITRNFGPEYNNTSVFGWKVPLSNKAIFRAKNPDYLRELRTKSKVNPPTNNNGMSLSDMYGGDMYKKGGILKALQGSKLWYSGLTDYDPNLYKYAYNTNQLVNGDMSDNNWNPWVSNLKGLGQGRYLTSAGNTYDYTKGVEGLNYYLKFTNDLIGPDGTFTPMGEAWAKAVDALLPAGSLSTFHDANGNLRTSWNATNLDAYHRDPKQFNNLKDYVNYVRNDLLLGARHNVFLNEGTRYFYKDNKGVLHWVNPADIGKYTVSKTPISSWNPDHTIMWNDYELTGPKVDPSIVNPAKSKQPNKILPNLFRAVGQVDPYSIGRLVGNIQNNFRVAKETKAGLHPLLLDPYNLNRQIVGDLATKQQQYGLAAGIESLAGQPRTADASLQLAGQLDANMKGNQLRTQGDLADNLMVRNTAEQAWQVQALNVARHNQVANQNRQSLIGIDKAKHDIDAARISANWTSLENFLKEQEYNWKQNRDRQRDLDLQVINQGLQLKYLKDSRLTTLQNIILRKYTDPNFKGNIEDLPEYKQYNELNNLLTNEYNNAMMQAQASLYGLKYRPYVDSNPTFVPTAIKSNVPAKKDGGTLEAAKIRARVSNAKMFNDNIKESVRHYEKMINNLSSVTKELIIKSMTLK